MDKFIKIEKGNKIFLINTQMIVSIEVLVNEYQIRTVDGQIYVIDINEQNRKIIAEIVSYKV